MMPTALARNWNVWIITILIKFSQEWISLHAHFARLMDLVWCCWHDGCREGGMCCLAVRRFLIGICQLTRLPTTLAFPLISLHVTWQFIFVPLAMVITGCVSKKVKFCMDLFCPEYHDFVRTIHILLFFPRLCVSRSETRQEHHV